MGRTLAEREEPEDQEPANRGEKEGPACERRTRGPDGRIQSEQIAPVQPAAH